MATHVQELMSSLPDDKIGEKSFFLILNLDKIDFFIVVFVIRILESPSIP